MRRLIRLLTALMLVEMVLAALGYLSPDRWSLLGALAFALLVPTTALLGMFQRLGRRLPDLAADLPIQYRKGEALFDARVKARFPPGTPEDVVKAEVLKQGFKLSPVHNEVHDATLSRGWIIRTIWSVRWRSTGERITDVWGVYGGKGP